MKKIKNWTKNSSGITLIALVITIIVLLILAGVSLSLIMGNDGILGRAENAVTEHTEAQQEEQEELTRADLTAEFYEKKYVDNDPTVGDSVTDYVNSAMGKQTFASQITKDNYGEYVNLGTTYVKGNALEIGTATEDWRIFHKDEDGGIYLILADYLPYSYEEDLETGLEYYKSSDEYSYTWISNESRIDLIDRLKGTASDFGGVNPWNKLIENDEIDYISKGIKVTGALELETWVNSWNAKGYTQLYTTTDTGMYTGLVEGYLIGKEGEQPYTTVSLNSDVDGCGNTLYFPHKKVVSNCYGYWLASPSASYAAAMMFVNCYDSVWNDDYDNYHYSSGIRPTVYIPAGINAEKVGDIWKLDV